METVGYAALQIIPTTKGLAAGLSAQVAAPLAATGKTAGTKFSNALTGASSPALQSLAKGAGLVGLAAAAGVTVAVRAFAGFDQAMSSVEAATHGTVAELGALRTAALKAGADTVFSATQAAGGVTALAKAGVSTADILNGGLAGALDLAAAGSIDVATAAEGAATAMSQFGLTGQDVPHVADLLAAAAGKAQGEVTDFNMALKQSGLVANQTGLSIEETTGALAAFASQGLIGSDAGTSLKAMLQSLTPSSGKAAKAMDEFGLSAYDAQGNFVGLSKYAGVLRDGLKDMTDEQRNATLKTIFGSDAVRAATVLYDEGARGIDKWVTAVDDQGFAADTAAIKLDNLSGDLEALKGSLETALIGTGKGADGPLRQLVQRITDVTNAYNDLPDGAKSAVLGIGSVVAVAGTGLFAFSKIAAGVVALNKNLATLGVNATAGSLAMSGFGAAVAGVGGLYVLVKGLNAVADALEDAPATASEASLALSQLATDSGVGDAAAKFGDLGEAIERVTDKSNVQSTFDALHLPTGVGMSLNEAEGSITALDTALAELVAGGNSAAAADGLDALAAAQGLTGDEMAALKTQLPGYDAALADVESAALLTKDAHEKLGDKVGSVKTEFEQHEAWVRGVNRAYKAEIVDLNNTRIALDKLTDRRAAAIGGMVGFEQAIDDARKEGRTGRDSLDAGDQAGRDNITALLTITDSWNALSDAQQRQPGAYKRVKQVLKDTTRDMGGTKKDVQEYRDLLEKPTAMKPTRAEFIDAEARKDVRKYNRWLKSQEGIFRTVVTAPGIHFNPTRTREGRGVGPSEIRPGGTSPDNRVFINHATFHDERAFQRSRQQWARRHGTTGGGGGV